MTVIHDVNSTIENIVAKINNVLLSIKAVNKQNKKTKNTRSEYSRMY